ncbi:hypothetical protein ACHHYP_14169 [Achlya hypogyna]|uniref:Transmembrane protein n=1 Tax=Achlya hypogyna TaxID=1202772 RepID=A0A1V9YDX5_ACHHY|nr:hypothetical protein ACHHYP_14169 [Achlya hypogyna]
MLRVLQRRAPVRALLVRPSVVGQYQMRSLPIHSAVHPTRMLAPAPTVVRTLYTNPDDWRRNATWQEKAKAGAVVVAGVGVFVIASSVAMGVVVTGIIGLGAYGLYRSFRDSRAGAQWMQAKNNALFSNTVRSGLRGGSPRVAGMPFVLQGLVTGLFSLVGGVMKQSMGRVATIQKATNERLQGHPSITRQFGSNVRVSSPEQLSEQTVNGVGHIQAVFPVEGNSSRARVHIKAAIDSRNDLSYQQLLCVLGGGESMSHSRASSVDVNTMTGESIDLLQHRFSPKPRVVQDAEFKEL